MENQRMLPCLPQDPIVQSAPAKRLVMSWWDREVHIWRISKLGKAKETLESDSESEERNRSRKLVAKVLIKGEANITSACLAANGSLLAVSTTSEVKLFRLRSRNGDQGDSLRVSKLELSETLSRYGARLVQFSRDGRWLVIVRRDNRIVAARILVDVTKPSSLVKVLPSPSKLSRLDRKIEKVVTFGGLGNYKRTINRIAFSSDSRILAVSDLAGYIDTWVLNGDEDLTSSEGDDISSDAAESSDDESDSDEVAKPVTLKGQYWTRNPSASSLPKLPAAAVILSFRPSTTVSASKTEDRLLVVTASSIILEFEVLGGGLTPWSRRNPIAKFPEEFRGLRDQAMGCLWDVAESKERLWLYGSRWMFMFDLSRDFPSEEEMKPSRKRKHSFSAGRENLRRGASGAGGKIPDNELDTGMSRKMQRVLHEDEEDSQMHEFDLRNHHQMDLDDEDEDGDERMEFGKQDEEKTSALERLRRGADVLVQGDSHEHDDRRSADQPPHWWHTYKYRPIMGVVPLGGGESTTGKHSGNLEVALIERPEWELDLPPRYCGDQEWEKPGL